MGPTNMRAQDGSGGAALPPGPTPDAVRQEVVDRIRSFARQSLKARVLGVAESPLLGPAGNREFLIGIEKT